MRVVVYEVVILLIARSSCPNVSIPVCKTIRDHVQLTRGSAKANTSCPERNKPQRPRDRRWTMVVVVLVNRYD